MTDSNQESSTVSSVILNVDDDEPTRCARTRILREGGFVVHDAGTGQDVLAMAAVHGPDLVLLAGVNRTEVCRRLKESSESSSVLVLQICSSPTPGPQGIGENGVDSCLVEPVDPAALIATVRALLRIRNAERELACANAALWEANTRFERLNNELRRSNNEFKEFASIASHDIQEPLRTVTAFIQIIETTLHERFTDEERKYFAYVVNGAGRIKSLIDAVVNYSQAGCNHRDKHTPMDLGYAVYWATENLKGAISESGSELLVAPLPRLLGDASQLGNVFQNLISNAIQYRERERPLKIEIKAVQSPDRTCWVVSVRDNGIGVEERYHEQIFKPFKRLHGPSIPGTGIGLALCRRIIETHEGRIWIESIPGSGSEFFFTLPAALRSPS